MPGEKRLQKAGHKEVKGLEKGRRNEVGRRKETRRRRKKNRKPALVAQ